MGITREYTIHLRKLLHGIGYKKRAPRAVKGVKEFAKKMMKTEDVRVDTKLNKFLWSRACASVSQEERRRGGDREAVHPLHTCCGRAAPVQGSADDQRRRVETPSAVRLDILNPVGILQ